MAFGVGQAVPSANNRVGDNKTAAVGPRETARPLVSVDARARTQRYDDAITAAGFRGLRKNTR